MTRDIMEDMVHLAQRGLKAKMSKIIGDFDINKNKLNVQKKLVIDSHIKDAMYYYREGRIYITGTYYKSDLERSSQHFSIANRKISVASHLLQVALRGEHDE